MPVLRQYWKLGADFWLKLKLEWSFIQWSHLYLKIDDFWDPLAAVKGGKVPKNVYCCWGAAITAKIYCLTHFFQSQWDRTDLRSSYTPSKKCQVLSLVGLILGLIVLKPPWTVPFSGPPPQGSRHIANFCQESVQMCWNKPGECVCQVSRLYHLVRLQNWFVIWVTNANLGPQRLPKMPHSIGPPPPWCCRNFKILRGGGLEIGLVQHGWPLQPKFWNYHGVEWRARES
jgi:hypothetical protein